MIWLALIMLTVILALQPGPEVEPEDPEVEP